MNNISDALKNIVKELAIPELRYAAIPTAWKNGVGDELARHTSFIDLKKKRLFIAVADPMWKKQLEKMSGRLVYLINCELGEGSIVFIEFVIDLARVETERAKEQQKSNRNVDFEQRAKSEITPGLEKSASEIDNKNLRDLFLGAASHSLLRKKERGTN